ncbi:hypothetical protein ASD11_01650 [Aeromicrobium sp. Root495]|nr:hypothetical protein ASD11_01650 [Aeromicrobium sp. Root495]
MAGVAGVAVLAGGLWATRTLADADDAPPTALRATKVSTTSAELDWKVADDADHYVVRVGADRSLTKNTVKVESRTTKVVVEDLKASVPGKEQFFRVDAVRDGTVTSSRTGRFSLAPARMAKVSVDKRSAGGVRLDWKAVANARQYDVQVARDKKFTKNLTTVRTLGPGSGFVQQGLSADSRYWFRIRPVGGDSVGAFGAPVAVTTRPREVAFNIATWNVCSEKCSGYAGRARVMADYLNENQADVFVLQESGGKRVGATTNAIFSGGKRQFVRATGGAKARYVFYRPELFRQLSGGNFDIGDGRNTTWAELALRETGRRFIVVDVHLENGHGNDGKRRREANRMVARMEAINTADLPIIYAGDFNSGRHRPSDSPGAIMRQVGQTDAVDLADEPVNRDINTGHTFATTVLRSGAHVDHIFVSKEFEVLGWKQLARLAGGRYASPVVSDHNALRATVALDARKVDVGEPTPTTLVSGLTSDGLQ